ncbi:hypothetical protein [Leptospira levettii]|uniref:Uncharacterized protein n=1 Tax=Leptospira levettii TaxID=2023178 RepID=A0AAW5VH84_9LEPT|nr:hypothetical protein [Leptospira levettii]MCW7512128.1 hypothetical protein [Leptospira levettii]MCW7517272.1 hypothetical protein [Leptospira levettii]
MEFIFVDHLIKGIELDLEILEKNSNNFSMLMFQHKGTFCTQNGHFGNQIDESFKFSKFFKICKNENVNLALTPEYSCPWTSIESLIKNNDDWPIKSNLWAICCESISPFELAEFKKRFSNDSVLIYHEEFINPSGKKIFDPLCYIFQARVEGKSKLIIIIQFKTQHMGVWDSPIERDNYIPGKKIYVFRNKPYSIYLFSNICSEAEQFQVTNDLRSDFSWDEHPYIILNPQMNPKPSHDIFKSYRKKIQGYLNKEVITLNWSSESDFLDGEKKITKFIHNSRSSIFFKTSEFDSNNEKRIIENHKKGLYYFNRKKGCHAYFLNPKAELFLISNQKISAAGTNESMVRKTGPEVMKVFNWNAGNGRFDCIETVDDEFTGYVNSLSCESKVMIDGEVSFIDKERLMNLTNGNINLVDRSVAWHVMSRLDSFILDENESIKRLTYVFDESNNAERRNYIEYIDAINLIIKKPENFPDNLVSFINNCNEIRFPISEKYTDYRFNLVTNDLNFRATVAYIGRESKGRAQEIMCKLQGLFEEGNQSRKLVVVWYKEGPEKISYVSEEKPPNVMDDSYIESNSIIKD